LIRRLARTPQCGQQASYSDYSRQHQYYSSIAPLHIMTVSLQLELHRAEIRTHRAPVWTLPSERRPPARRIPRNSVRHAGWETGVARIARSRRGWCPVYSQMLRRIGRVLNAVWRSVSRKERGLQSA